MLLRLWWKEWRTMWPLWAAMPIIAGLIQALVRALAEPDVRSGALVPLALGWAAIYALAVSSAAFAGERENQTLLWLDVLPVSRRLLWGSKTSFALLSTLLLVLPLTLLGLLGTPDRTVFASRAGGVVIGFGALFIECVAWGVFWSALARNALFAGTLAAVSAGTAVAFGNLRLFFDLDTAQRGAPQHLALAALLCAVSLLVMTRRPGRTAQAPRIPQLTTVAQRVRNVIGRRTSANRSLAWLTRRQGFWMWLACTGAATVGLFGFYAWTEGRTAAGVLISVVSTFAGLVAGLCVFHPDNRGRMCRFYVHHGVSPMRIWTVKVVVWAVPVAIASLPVAAVGWFVAQQPRAVPFTLSTIVAILVSPVICGFVAGLLSGQVVERAVSATVVAFSTLILLWPLQAIATVTEFFPAWFLVISPSILLLASLAWSRDWVFSAPGVGRWLRLAAWLVLPFAAYLAGAIAYRAWSLPKIDPIPPPTAAAEGIHGAEAADFYASAFRAELGADTAFTAVQNGGAGTRRGPQPMRPVEPSVIDAVIVGEHDPKDPDVVAWWRANRKAIELIRQGSQQRTSGFFVPTTLLPQRHNATVSPRMLKIFAWLMALDGRECAAHGDLRQAWDDVLAVWRMARQASVGTDVSWTEFATELDRKASHMAMLWAQDPHQTRELLHAALDDMGAMPEEVPLADAYRTEGGIWERTIQRPVDELKPFYCEIFGGNPRNPAVFLSRVLLLNSWERERCRRAGRLFFAYMIASAEQEPWKSDVKTVRVPTGHGDIELSADAVLAARRSTPALRIYSEWLLRFGNPATRALVDRRALIQVLALRSWALAHGGNLPERLDALVPSELPRLPLDPYSGTLFRLEPGEVRMATPLGWFASGNAGSWKVTGKAVRGAQVLSSVGPKEGPYLPGPLLYAIPGNTPEQTSAAP